MNMPSNKRTPDYIFESSWEVCNKVGGIYTVLSTRAKTLQDAFADRLFFIGPDFWKGKENVLFVEDKKLYKDWIEHARSAEQLGIRAGRWNIPGKPIVFLVDFNSFLNSRMIYISGLGKILKSIRFMHTEIMMRRRCSLMPQVKL